jgi:hypothetical protein
VVLARDYRNFGEPLVIHFVHLVLVCSVPNHSNAINGGDACFYEEDRIG